MKSHRSVPPTTDSATSGAGDDGKKPDAGPQLSFEARFTAIAPRPATPAKPAPPPAEPAKEARILAVAELVRAARQTLESRFGDVRVEGEVSGCKRSANGHLYFTLKDTEAQLDCVMYSRDAGRLKFKLGDGQLVRCRGKLTIYEGRGRFQLQVSAIEPAGAGALALAFEALKQKLLGEGLFDSARKRSLPFLPRRIGVVTSRQGAVIRDIVRVAHRRFPVPILLAPTPVQGEGAAASIAAALIALCQVPDVDVIILARGGGSMEDLWAFNDENLARTIAACPLPTISAIGHETDFTIADFVADVRAPTPSAAAELAVPVAAERGEVHDLVVVHSPHHDAVDLHRRHPRVERGVDAGEHTVELVAPGERKELLTAQRVEGDVHAGEARRVGVGVQVEIALEAFGELDSLLEYRHRLLQNHQVLILR